MRTNIQKTHDAQVMKGATPGTFRFRISDGSEDRVRDRINVRGWQLDNYWRAPVVLWAHDHSIPAIAKTIEIGVERDALMATLRFPPRGIHPLEDQICDLITEGTISSTSVGFRPLRYTANDIGGTDFLEQELQELSIVNVGCLPTALLEGRSQPDKAAVTKWLGQSDNEIVLELLDDEMIDFDPRDLVDAMRTALPVAMKAVISDAVKTEIRGRGLTIPPADRFAQHYASDADIKAALAGALPDIFRDLIPRDLIGDLTIAALNRARGRVD